MSEREQLVQNIQNSIPMVSVAAQYAAEHFELKEKLKKAERPLGCLTGFISAAAVVWIFLSLYVVVVIVYALLTESTLTDEEKKEFYTLLLILLVVMLPAVLWLLFRSIVTKRKKKKLQAEIALCLSKAEAVWNDPCFAWLPPYYRGIYSFDCIRTYVENGRADTLKEALNLLEMEHRRR